MPRLVYVGTYTEKEAGGPGKEEGLYVLRMDPASGRLEPVMAVAAGPNPSWLAIHPNRRVLYAVNERNEGQISALAINPASGAPRLLNSQPIPGSVPCYASLDPSGKWLMAANYGNGSLVVLPVAEDGQVGPVSDYFQHQGKGPNPARQEGPHAHSILFDPSGRFVLSADLGLDQILIYRLDIQQGKLVPSDPPYGSTPPGSGPRHMVFHPNGRYLFVSNEVDSSVTSMAWDGKAGTLHPVQSLSTLPIGWSGENNVADIHLSPSGRSLHVSNRGHNSLAIFSTNEWTGTLFPNGHVSTGGDWPRNFAIDPNGAFLLAANQNSGTIVTFRLEPGSEQPVNTRQVTPIPSPVCIKMLEIK